MNKYLFEDIVHEEKGFLRGPFGGDLKKDIFVPKSSNTYKVYEQGVVLQQDESIGRYYISEEYFNKKMNRFEVRPKDFLVSCSGVNYGAIYQLGEDIEQGVINQALLRIRLNNDIVDDDYFLYFFQHHIVNMIVGKKGDSTIPNFPPISVIKKLEFSLPELEVQREVGKVLKQISQKIELNNKINAELEGMAKLLYDYWFVQFDFPDANFKPYKSSGGKMVYNEQLKREIPEGWDDGVLGDYCPSTGGFAFKSSWWSETGVSVIKIKDIREDYTIDVSDLAKADLADKKVEDKFKATAGNVLIAMTGATVGKYAIVPFSENPIYVNQRVGYFNLGVDPFEKLPFLINSLNQEYIREVIFTLASGAAQPNISNEQINNIQLVIPNENLIADYNKKMQSCYKQILNNQKENQKLSELRDWLLPMLMNGQVSVHNTTQHYNLPTAEQAPLAAETPTTYNN